MKTSDQKKLIKNFILNNIRLLTNLFFPLIVFPYTSRVLLPDGIGNVEYANSVMSYFILVCGLGIPIYGIRAIARNNNDKSLLSKTVIELTIILLITNSVGYFFYFILIFSPNFSSLRNLFVVISPALFLSSFSYEWFYIGIENQKYITYRFLITKIIQIVSIFVFIKSKDDFILYALVSVGMTGISTIFNILKIRTYITFLPLKEIQIKKHILPLIAIFSSILASSIYMQLDTTMVGLISGSVSVGLYTVANKLIRICIAIVNSYGVVLIPRLEKYFSENKIDLYILNLQKSINFTFLFSIPIFISINLLASDLITVFAGSQFIESIVSIRLLSPIIIIVGLAHFFGIQLMYSQRMEKEYAYAVVVGSIVNFIFNLVSIPKLQQNGAIIGTVFAETSGLIMILFYSRNIIKKIPLISRRLVKYLCASLMLSIVILLIKYSINNSILVLVVSFVVGTITYFLSILLFSLRKKNNKMKFQDFLEVLI